MSDPDFPAIFNQVHGFLSLAEAETLYTLASQVPNGGVIVEIGAFQGRSTVCLGLGAKEAGALVYSIDPHDEYTEGDTHYGMADQAALLKNLLDFEVADIVRVVTLKSNQAWFAFYENIDLLWIDGSHSYMDIGYDLTVWSRRLTQTGKIALHDTAGYHPDVTRALSDFMRDNEQWTICEKVDAITVMERFNASKVDDV